MLFVAIFLLILAVVFTFIGIRSGNKNMRNMGIIFLIAAFGAGWVTFFAYSAFS